MFEPCDLIKRHLIPKEELDRVFTESETASAEMDATYLCFEDDYRYVLENTSPEDIIVDLGCGYNAQCFYFKDYDRYIAVDLPFENNVRFDSGNVEFYLMSIQQFIKEELPKIGLDLDKCVAVCNAVPDTDARQMVMNTFPRHYVAYPGQRSHITIGDKSMENPNKIKDLDKINKDMIYNIKKENTSMRFNKDNFVLDDDIVLSENEGAEIGYAWATDDLVALTNYKKLLKEAVESRGEVYDDEEYYDECTINFYPSYDTNTEEVKLIASYYIFNEYYEEGIELSKEEKEYIKEEFDSYYHGEKELDM